jgi:hypothetical protein
MMNPLTVVAVTGVRERPDDLDVSSLGVPASIPNPTASITMTITAAKPWGMVTVSATASGPHAVARAGWQAFTRLEAALPGMTLEHRALVDGRWQTVLTEPEEPSMADEPTPLHPAQRLTDEQVVAELVRLADADELPNRLAAQLNGALIRRAGRQFKGAIDQFTSALGGGKQ